MALAAILHALTAAHAQHTPPDEALWRQIDPTLGPPATSQPYEEWLRQSGGRLRLRLERLALYQRLYPGARHRDEAAALELRTLYDLGTLTGGELTALCVRTRELLERPPSAAIEAEAAYWELLCRRVRAATPTSQPASQPVAALDEDLNREYDDYVRRYPGSPYTPRLAGQLAEQALERGQIERGRALAELLRKHFPGHTASEALDATLLRIDAVGKPFRARFKLTVGGEVDTAAWIGRVGVILVWAGYDARSRAALRELTTLAGERPELQLVGVCLDERPEAIEPRLREAGGSWPQAHDGLGRAGEFVRTWGISEIPQLFVIGRDSQLLAVYDLRHERRALEALIPR